MQGSADSVACADTSVQQEAAMESAAHAMELEVGAEHAADPENTRNDEHESTEMIDCEEAAGVEQAPAPAPAPAPALAPALAPDDRPYQLRVRQVSTAMHP